MCVCLYKTSLTGFFQQTNAGRHNTNSEMILKSLSLYSNSGKVKVFVENVFRKTAL